MKRIILNIAGIRIGFEFEDKDDKFFYFFNERYFPFYDKIKPKQLIKVRFDEKVFLKNEGVLVNGIENIKIRRKDFYFDGKILNLNKNIYSFDSFLRVYLSNILNKKNGLMLHSSGVSIKNKGFIFVSKSGGGKTTIARILSNQCDVLCDEIIPVVFENNKIYAFSSPFYGEINLVKKNIKVELAKIFLIKKSDTNLEKELDFKEKINRIIKCVMNFNKDKNIILKVFKKVIKLSKSNVYQLNFRNDNTLLNYFY